MRILPQKYDELSIDKYDKQFIALMKSTYKENEMFLLCCNPTKNNGGICHVLITERGVALFHIMSGCSELPTLMQTILNGIPAKKEESEILSARFQHQRNLQRNGRTLFPQKIVYLFPDIDKPNLDMFLGVDGFKDFVEHTCLFKEFWKDAQRDKSYLDRYLWGDEGRTCITEDLIPDIINRVAPEYTIPQAKAAIESPKVTRKTTAFLDGETSAVDRAAVAYMLDEGQINYINKIKKGDQLIIACAGSGKSVILISKCFKVAGLNPDKRFLITGYNRNLVSYFKWLIESAGFSTNNVECLTFDKLCVKLLQDNGIRVPLASGGDYSRIRECLIQNMKAGHIKNRYYGVFIDEVQMFEPEWYKVCYDLVENKNSDEHFFVICGDKSQSVKTSIKSGKAPWQGHGDLYPNFRGKSFPIEINYRNSIQINEYIRRFTDRALAYAERLGIPVNQDADIFLRGKSIREGLDLQYLEVSQKFLDSDAEAIMVLNQIIDIHDNYHIPYDSIAVICYNRQYSYVKGRAERHYTPIDHLKNYLGQANIPYSLLNSTASEYGVSYSNISGVPIVTMESSLGLDFRAVIICGLLPLGLHDHTKELEQLKSNCSNEDIIDAFNKNITILYMACARAKDILRIVSADSEEKSFYVRLLKEAFFQEVE